MKVECLALIDAQTGEAVEKNSWLTVGKVYRVLSVFMASEGVIEYRLIADDGRTPGMYRASQFKVVSDKLPSNWAAYYEAGSYFELAPKSWIEPGFWENYFDGDPVAIKQFESEIELIAQLD